MEEINIEEMKAKLGEVGARVLWGYIEKIGNWEIRVAYRNVFFLAGGSLD
jgi:hypothetical protein